jgi:radical SAM superfamily enzyme YgiQ (UPF0313 family)
MAPQVNSYRRWSPNLVIQEVKYLVERWGVRYIKIPDEMFVLNPNHVLAIADGIAKHWGDYLNIWAYARVDTTKPEFLDRLRRAGFRWLGIGIESGSSYVREGAEKSLKEDDIVRVVERVHSSGIEIGANYIFGLPDDTCETMQATLDLAKELNTLYANFYCAMAYPGSSLHSIARQKAWKLPEDEGGPGWIGYSQHSYETLPLRTEFLSAKEILAFRDSAWLNYYTSKSFLESVKLKIGERGVVAINNMTSSPSLKRSLLDNEEAFWIV